MTRLADRLSAHPVAVATLLALALAAVSLVMTYPLVTDLTGTIPGPPGDNFEYVYKLWWFEHAVLEQHVSPFVVLDVFWPFGYEIALSETTLAHTILGMPLTAAFGEVAAYNLLLVWSCVLAGLGAYLYTRRLARSSAAGLIAALVFALLPYRLSHLAAGHLPLLGVGWLPLLLLYLDRTITARRGRDGVLAGLFFGMLALSSWYYAYMGALLVLAYTLLRARPWRTYLPDIRFWRAAGVAVVVAGIVMLPALLPLLNLAARGELARTTLSLRYVDQWSASAPDFLLPSIMHPLWGEHVAGLYPQNVHESLLWLGVTPLLLAFYAVARRRTLIVTLLAVVGCGAAVLALGTTLHWAGEPVYLAVPPAVEQAFSRAMYALTGKYALNPATYSSMYWPGYIVLPLPTLALYLFLPFFSAMRVWARFGLIVGLVVAVLAGVGVRALQRWPRWSAGARSAVAGVVVCLVLFEFASAPFPFGVSSVRAQPVDEWLRAQPGHDAVVMLPIEKTWHGPALYAARQHGKPIAYGYGTYTPADYRVWQQALAGFPDEASLQAIAGAGIHYVVVGLRSYGEREAEMRQRLASTPRLRLVFQAEERLALRGDRLTALVRPSAVVPTTELIGAVRYAYLVDDVVVYELER